MLRNCSNSDCDVQFATDKCPACGAPPGDEVRYESPVDEPQEVTSRSGCGMVFLYAAIVALFTRIAAGVIMVSGTIVAEAIFDLCLLGLAVLVVRASNMRRR